MISLLGPERGSLVYTSGECYYVNGPDSFSPTQQPTKYCNWRNAEPNDSGMTGGEDCGQLFANALWNDIPCEPSGIQQLPGYTIEYGGERKNSLIIFGYSHFGRCD